MTDHETDYKPLGTLPADTASGSIFPEGFFDFGNGNTVARYPDATIESDEFGNIIAVNHKGNRYTNSRDINRLLAVDFK